MKIVYGTPSPLRTSRRSTRALVACALLTLVGLVAAASPAVAQESYDVGPAACLPGPNQVDYAMYYLADVRDDTERCSQHVVDGSWVTGGTVVNPAMTCPDMFAWRLYINAIRDQWWSRWADERQNWPAKPYPLCVDGGTPGVSCCMPGASNNPKGHCPVFPGDAAVALGRRRALGEEGPPPKDQMRIGLPSVMSHMDALSKVSPERLQVQLGKLAEIGPELDLCPPDIVDHLVPEDYESIGRVIRQTNAEVTVRDRPFHEYLFRNNLYNETGVAAVFETNSKNLAANAPYRQASHTATPENPKADLSRIELPPEAVMIKSNWLHEAIAAKLGIHQDPEHPFIEKYMATTLNLNKEGTEQCLLPGIHYLVAFHISSKDIPNWVWATFEHVELPGRCDITGCNDSYGYKSSDELPAGAADNYVVPHTHWDELNSGSCVYDRDLTYAVEAIRPPLAELFDQLGIGVAPSRSPNEPTPADLGWRDYRLKGSQVEFTDSTGRPTFLGNSVTEAGFMDGSSCITCHARAGIHVDSDGGSTFFKLGVFINSLSDFGYGRSAHGVPNPAWYNDSAQPPSLEVLQTDFVWGFLFAQPLVVAPDKMMKSEP